MTSEPHITIKFDVIADILLANWKGNLSQESIRDGCEKILYHLQQQHCHKVLNDNSQVTSMWTDASEWIARDWFPRLGAAGCSLFAWVYSPDVYSKLSVDKTLEFGIHDVIVFTFRDKNTAKAWLQAMQ